MLHSRETEIASLTWKPTEEDQQQPHEESGTYNPESGWNEGSAYISPHVVALNSVRPPRLTTLVTSSTRHVHPAACTFIQRVGSMAGLAVTSTSLRASPCLVHWEEAPRRRGLGRVRCAQVQTESSVPGEKRKYKDSFTDLVFINGCREAFGRVAGWQSPRSWEEGYEGMVEVSHALARNRNAAEQQAAVLKGFPKVPNWFRKLFPYSDWGAELNARITPLFFSWLVGPCEVVEVTVKDKTLKSGVQIEKCRYLETSGCTGLCVNSCKMPTQYFFTTELGMPLTMEPNFDDMSCLMIFGQTPPAPEEDVVFKQKCCSSTCPTSNPASEVCPKLR